MKEICKRWIGAAVLLLSGLMFLSASPVWAATYEYDDLNRLTKIIYESGDYIEYEYDAAGNIVGVSSPDMTPPVPDVDPLPTISGECAVSIGETEFPTATDNTAGTVTGTTTDPLSYTDQGTYIITWTYDDGNGNIATQTQTVVVKDTEAPNPEKDPLPDIGGQCSAEITEFPTATDNTAGTVTGTTTDPLSYTDQGTYIITWTYDDGNGNKTTQTQTVTVADTEAPEIKSVTAVPNVLWPPDHKMVAVTVEATADDNCDESPECMIVSVNSNQDVNGLGDGNTEPDWSITGGLAVDLRAERSGKGNGDRVYTITVECVDNVGNSSSSTVDVTVPHDKGKK
jgi:YD repeat-containing protein